MAHRYSPSECDWIRNAIEIAVKYGFEALAEGLRDLVAHLTRESDSSQPADEPGQ